jgi:hypothetical protein
VWWNRDNPNELFDRYIIDPKHPFSERPSWKPNTDSWIFAPREGIDQIAARLRALPEAETEFSHTGSVDPPKPPVGGPEPEPAARAEESRPEPSSTIEPASPAEPKQSAPTEMLHSSQIRPPESPKTVHATQRTVSSSGSRVVQRGKKPVTSAESSPRPESIPSAKPQKRRRKRRGGGRHEIWNWLSLKELLLDHKPFNTADEFLTFALANVSRVDEKPRGNGPDRSTVRHAIKKHRLRRCVKIHKKR